MAEPEAVRIAYERAEPLLTEILRYVRDILRPYCANRDYPFLDRIKELPSLSEKLEGGRFASWSEVDDLYACTVVVPVASHEEQVIRKLEASFRRVKLRTKRETKKPPDVFRYDCTRWYGTIKPDVAAHRQPHLADVTFEVQVLTAFEYAWTVVTHDLVYKDKKVDWRRQRLASQLKAAVEQIEVVISAFDSASGAVVESPWPTTAAGALVIQRCQLLADDGLIPESLLPQSWRRFADNVCALVLNYRSNKRQVAESVGRLLDAMDEDLRGPEPSDLPLSGSLFQYVIAMVDRTEGRDGLNGYPVVASRELQDLYGVTSIPSEFTFDGPVAARGETD